MGNIFATLFQRFFVKREVRIVMMGLDAAGKTTILYKLKLGEIVTTIPTIGITTSLLLIWSCYIILCFLLGFNVETVVYKNISFNVWDLGGGDKMRPLYRHYFDAAVSSLLLYFIIINMPYLLYELLHVFSLYL